MKNSVFRFSYIYFFSVNPSRLQLPQLFRDILVILLRILFNLKDDENIPKELWKLKEWKEIPISDEANVTSCITILSLNAAPHIPRQTKQKHAAIAVYFHNPIILRRRSSLSAAFTVRFTNSSGTWMLSFTFLYSSHTVKLSFQSFLKHPPAAIQADA